MDLLIPAIIGEMAGEVTPCRYVVVKEKRTLS